MAVALGCLLLLSTAASQQTPPQRPLGVPYFDRESGQICEERTATVEEMEVGDSEAKCSQ